MDILSLQPETFLPLFESLCKRVPSLQAASETLRVDSVASRRQLILHQQTFGGELTLLQDRLGCDPGLTDVPLRSSWEGISFLHSLVLESLQPNVVSPLLQQQITTLFQQLLPPTLVTLQAVKQQVVALERVLLHQLPHLSQLCNICSGGVNKPQAAALSDRLNRMSTQIRQLELQLSISSSSLGGFGLLAPPPVPPSSSTTIIELTANISRLEASYSNLKSSIGQEVVSLGGVTFEFLRQTTQLVRQYLPSGDSPTLLDSFSSSHLTTKEFLDENYQASRGGHFNNASEARVSASFARELPPIFGKVDSSASGVPSSSSHPLPSMKTYDLFNSPETHSGIKQIILDEMDNIFDSISGDITSCLSSSSVALMLANTLLVQSKAIVDSLLTWIESFYQELQAGAQSSPKDAW